MKITKTIEVEVCDYCKKNEDVVMIENDYGSKHVCHQLGCVQKAVMESMDDVGFDQEQGDMIFAKFYLSDRKRKAKII